MDNDRGPMLKLSASIYRNPAAGWPGSPPPARDGLGWVRVPVELPLAETALVSMHAWSSPDPGQVPPGRRIEEYVPRARRILETVFPPLLSAAREAGMAVLHVVGGGDYYRGLPAYQRSVSLAGADPEFTGEAPHSDSNIRLRALKARWLRPNPEAAEPPPDDGFRLDFAPQAVPLPGEGIAENGAQLSALCRERGLCHLVYIGFAINWCLLTSAGGMRDMARRWYLCSAIRDATTAVENADSAATEAHKEEGLWRVATGYGFVFDAEPFIAALRLCRGAGAGRLGS